MANAERSVIVNYMQPADSIMGHGSLAPDSIHLHTYAVAIQERILFSLFSLAAPLHWNPLKV